MGLMDGIAKARCMVEAEDVKEAAAETLRFLFEAEFTCAELDDLVYRVLDGEVGTGLAEGLVAFTEVWPFYECSLDDAVTRAWLIGRGQDPWWRSETLQAVREERDRPKREFALAMIERAQG